MSSSTPLDQLKEEIDAKKKLISTMPSWGSRCKKGLSKADHVRILAQKEEEYELILESNRVASVVRAHEEIHPPKKEECPICLETISISDFDSMVLFPCCGNGFCKECDQDASCEGVDKMPSCPLCRAERPSEEEFKSLMKQRAEGGRSWAQAELGWRYWNGAGGLLVDKKEALKWLELAAEQRDQAALASLADIYWNGDGVVQQSRSRAMAMMKEAADLRWTYAQVSLADMHFSRNQGAEDEQKGVFYATLAYGQDHGEDKHGKAAYELGFSFYNGYGGLSKSMHLAKHYFEESAGKGYTLAYFSLAVTLLQLGDLHYDGRRDIPGHNFIPSVLFWARKAALHGDSKADATKLIEVLGGRGKLSCANCKRDAESFSEKMKQCARCKAAWYCGRDCQVKHWIDGHKIDCINQN